MSGAARRQRGVILASATAAGAILLVTLLTTRGAERRADVPHHADPGLRAAARASSSLCGPRRARGCSSSTRRVVPAPSRHAGYRAAVRTAQRAGARVLGYVHTTYGVRPAAGVVADVDRYTSWYGVDGIFLDEATRHSLGLQSDLADDFTPELILSPHEEPGSPLAFRRRL